MVKVFGATSAYVAALALSAACTVHDIEPPALTGPSDFAQSIIITATHVAVFIFGRLMT